MKDFSNPNVSKITINGVQPTNTKVTKITTNFNLEQGPGCHCSFRPPYKICYPGLCPAMEEHWIWVEEHYPDCEYADPKRRIRLHEN